MKNIDYQILDAIEASIYWKDVSGRYLGCNEYMLRMIGLTRNELIGKTDSTLIWTDQAEQIKAVDQLVINDQKKYKFEEYVVIADGSNKVLLSSKSPLRNDKGEVIGIIGVSVDITHNKLFEKEVLKVEKSLDEYSSIKTRFLKNISHEARIPMNSVASISESLSVGWEKYSEKEKRENVRLIYEESKRLSRFILNTFDLSDLTKGDVEPNFKRYNLSELVRSVAAEYKKSFCHEKVEIKINSFDDYVLVFDQKLITQVIKNLLMNAVQYSQKQKNIVIDIKVSYLKNGEIPAVTCSVADEGIGIPEHEMKLIFNPFSESSRTASKACGTGIGLSLCREIIDLHLGEIWAENNKGKSGTTFNFSIPTNLFSFSLGEDGGDEKDLHQLRGKVFYRDLATLYPANEKKDFALVAISPFNSYFSAEKILEIYKWVSRHYKDFAVFLPDKISKYNLEAIGYDDSKINQKVRKHDNHLLNRVNDCLKQFYQQSPDQKEIAIYSLSLLNQNNNYKALLARYLDLFHSNRNFQKKCLSITEWIISRNNGKSGIEMDEFQQSIAKYTAVQYLLHELPAMINSASVLAKPSCDFIYHSVSDPLKDLYLNKDLVPDNQRFLILK
ncbi:MAG: hypothetical protein DGJ47_000194 [Rickettsiaceae bacterium]